MRTLNQAIRQVENREYLDDHLDNDEREALVRRFRKERPDIELPSDMTEAYIQIVLG